MMERKRSRCCASFKTQASPSISVAPAAALRERDQRLHEREAAARAVPAYQVVRRYVDASYVGHAPATGFKMKSTFFTSGLYCVITSRRR